MDLRPRLAETLERMRAVFRRDTLEQSSTLGYRRVDQAGRPGDTAAAASRRVGQPPLQFWDARRSRSAVDSHARQRSESMPWQRRGSTDLRSIRSHRQNLTDPRRDRVVVTTTSLAILRRRQSRRDRVRSHTRHFGAIARAEWSPGAGDRRVARRSRNSW